MTDPADRSELVLRPDARRVLARLFVPGHDLGLDTRSRATGVLARILALTEDEVELALARVLTRYAGRHRDLPGVLRRHSLQIEHRLPDGVVLGAQRRALLGAYFTHEFSVESAALFNPSAVAHPDQSGLADGELRFVLSLRAVGEGHLSSVEFRSGVLGADRQLRIDEPGPHVEQGELGPGPLDRVLLAARLTEGGADEESARFLLSRLGDRFAPGELDAALLELRGQRLTRAGGVLTEDIARRAAECSYTVRFPLQSTLSERVLWPSAPTESRGMEDVRLVRFHADDGSVVYRGTYTAYDGAQITPQVLQTQDFRTFAITQLAGPAATNKGLALFPRTVGGSHLALSRWDRENSSVATSADGLRWDLGDTVHGPTQPWELVQTGNCGSPIETEAGWLVLTHGVGPMREYAVGAVVLDLDDPCRVLGALREPLLVPEDDEREGYVPNVVYSCGALRSGDTLLLPYGCSDSSVRFAFVDLPSLLDRLVPVAAPATTRANTSS